MKKKKKRNISPYEYKEFFFLKKKKAKDPLYDFKWKKYFLKNKKKIDERKKYKGDPPRAKKKKNQLDPSIIVSGKS